VVTWLVIVNYVIDTIIKEVPYQVTFHMVIQINILNIFLEDFFKNFSC